MFQSGVMGLVGSLGAVSKIVLLLLFVASILSWGVIFYKWRTFSGGSRGSAVLQRVYEDSRSR
jgi:biopolymer transport protein TolQ